MQRCLQMRNKARCHQLLRFKWHAVRIGIQRCKKKRCAQRDDRKKRRQKRTGPAPTERSTIATEPAVQRSGSAGRLGAAKHRLDQHLLHTRLSHKTVEKWSKRLSTIHLYHYKKLSHVTINGREIIPMQTALHQKLLTDT